MSKHSRKAASKKLRPRRASDVEHKNRVGKEIAQLPPVVDVRVTGAGSSLFMFHLLTQDARSWVEDHVDGEAQFLGDALAVEPRYAEDLVTGMRDAGLEVQ